MLCSAKCNVTGLTMAAIYELLADCTMYVSSYSKVATCLQLYDVIPQNRLHTCCMPNKCRFVASTPLVISVLITDTHHLNGNEL